MAKRKNKINSIVAPYTPKTIRKVIKANTKLRFGEEGREIAGALRAGRQDSRDTNAWYAQNQNRMRGVVADQGKAAQALQNQMNANASYMRDANADQSRAVGAAEDRSAAIRGAVADPTAASRDQAAQTQRDALLASSRDRAAQMNTSTQDYLGLAAGAAELGRQADQRQIRNTQIETRNKGRALAREKGAFRVSERDRLTKDERDWDYQNRALNSKNRYSNAMVTQAQLGLAGKQASAAATLGAAELYSGAKVKAAKIYNAGNGQKVKGADVLRARDYLTAEIQKVGAKWTDIRKKPNLWISKLTDRGADPIAARVAVRRYIRSAVGPKPGSAAWAKEKKKRSGRK